MTEVPFARARQLVVDALRAHYAVKFPDKKLVARTSGRDLGDAWAVFLGLGSKDDVVDTDLYDAPVLIVSKRDGMLSLRQIPPAFEILDAPTVRDEESDSAHGVEQAPQGVQE